MSTLTLTTDQIDWDGMRGTAEASSLGIRPGERPAYLIVESTKVAGYALRFWFWNEEVREGDLLSSTYVATKDGKHVIVTVFND